MKTALSHTLGAGVAALLALTSVHASAPPVADARHAAAIADFQASRASTAQDMFPDAPYGVDPVVTGPVSDAFRSRQIIAGCDDANWPDVPAVCYPG